MRPFVQFAVAHHESAIGVRGDLGIVGDQDHGVVRVAQALEQAKDLFAGLAVERAGGFVGQQDRRLVDQRAGDRHALLLAAGEFAGQVPGALGQTDRYQCCTRALVALWDGSFGSGYALTSSTLVRATPLILTGLAVAIAFRAGVWNIGAEGQLLTGAATAAAVGLFATPAFGALTVVVALAVGALAGALWAWIAAYLRNRFGVLEVISTIMLNFVALYAVGYLVRGPLQEPTHIYPQSEPLPVLAQLPRLIEGSRLHWGFVLAVVAAPVVWWVLRSHDAPVALAPSASSTDPALAAPTPPEERANTVAPPSPSGPALSAIRGRAASAR